MSKSGGVFQIDDVTRTMSKGGGVRLVFHPSKFRPPPPPGWLATGLINSERVDLHMMLCTHDVSMVSHGVASQCMHVDDILSDLN